MKKIDQNKLNDSLSALIEEEISKAHLAGAAVIVKQSGKTVCELRLGSKNSDTGEPLAERTMFRIASMTKPVTGVACLIGLQKGWFDLHDKLSDYLPIFSDMYVGRMEGGKVVPDHKAKNDIYIYQLLSHCSGLLASDSIGVFQEDHTPLSAYASQAAMVEYCASQTYLSFEPGECTSYSGYAAFDALALIIEQKSGMKYADFVNQYIFRPLGLRDLTFNPTDEQWQRFSAMHDKADCPCTVTVNMGRHTYEQFPLGYTCAGASLSGTIEDYSVFAEMLRRGGEYEGVRIFDEKLLSLMRTPYVPDGTPGRDVYDSWGLGVRVAVHNPVLPEGAFGWSGAYGTHFWVDTENEISAVFMKNNRWYDSHGGGETGKMVERAVMEAMEG